MDYYQILGCSKTDPIEKIKKNYRKLALQYHPDKNPDGEEEFKKIAEAYEVLSDPDRKKTYDREGTFHFDTEKDPIQTFREVFVEMPEEVTDALKTMIESLSNSKEFSLLKMVYKSLPQNTKSDMSTRAYTFADSNQVPDKFMEIVQPLWK